MARKYYVENPVAEQCIVPPAMSDEQLSQYLDGTADAAVNEHIARCAFCRANAEALGRWQSRLQSRLYRANCPAPEQLGEFQLGLLTGARAMVMARHIAECPHCAAEVKQLRGFLDDEANQPDTETTSETLRGLLGGLVDVLTGQVRARSTASGGIRGNVREPLTIEAGEAQIILDVQPASEGQAMLLGQIASEKFEQWIGADVDLWQGGKPQRTATVDDIGTFQIDGVLPQHAELLVISTQGLAIHVPDLDLTLS